MEGPSWTPDPPPAYGLVGILADRSHPEHQVMRRWAGRRFDPAAFDPAKVHFDNPRKRWTIAFESE